MMIGNASAAVRSTNNKLPAEYVVTMHLNYCRGCTILQMPGLCFDKVQDDEKKQGASTTGKKASNSQDSFEKKCHD